VKWAEQASADPDVTGVRSFVTLFEARYYLQADLAAARASLDRIPVGQRTAHRVVAARFLVAMAEKHFDQALQELARVPEAMLRDRVYHGPKALLAGFAHEAAGRTDAAQAQFREAEQLLREELARDPDNEELRAVLALNLACLNRPEESRHELAAVEPLLNGQDPSVYSGQVVALIAQTHGRLGEPEQMTVWLRTLLTQPSPSPFTPGSLRLDPRFGRYVSEPAMQALLAEFAALDPAPAPVVKAKSIAVLPFANLSTDKENEFFADGVHDDVITSLAKIRDLKVISRTSVLAYRDPAARNLKKIAAELGVATVLEGSVRRVGNRVHMNAQLIDARTDEHLWADSFDGDTDDIFALQARLAQQIASALKATLTQGEKTLIERRPTENQEAYELYLRARAMQQDVGEGGTLADYERIVGVYGQAIAQDPSFALAHAQVALVHSITYWFGSLDPTPVRAEKMRAEVDDAVRLAPDAPETHFALGAYHYRVERDWSGALAEFRIAETGLPNDGQLMFWLGVTHRRLGKWTEAVHYFEQSIALNPRDLAVVTNYTGYVMDLRRWDQALAAATRFLGYFPANRDLSTSRAQAEFALNGDVEAYARATEKLPPNTADPTAVGDRFRAAVLRNDFAAADQVLADSRLIALTEPISTAINDPVAFFRAMMAFLRGDRESAQRFGDEATAFYQRAAWNPRQQPWVQMRIAMAQAWAGRPEEARQGAQAAMKAISTDAYDEAHLRQMLGQVLMTLDRREEAITCLQQMLAGPSGVSPNEIRIDPFWSRLKDDPRFEQILHSAKPL
jgi:TolB-like protein/Flp pilus assembly protein TadD